jgi:hypothetical protein
VKRNAEPFGEAATVAVVTVEQLEDAGRLARRANSLLDALAVDRVDEPDSSLRDERVRAAAQPLVVDDPSEPALELVAESDPHARSIVRAGSRLCALRARRSSGSPV